MHDFALKAGTGDIHGHSGHVFEIQTSKHRRRCGSIVTDQSIIDDPTARDAIECPAPFVIGNTGVQTQVLMAA